MRLIQDFYARIFCRKGLYKINRYLYFLSLRGMGILNYQNDRVSGERFFIAHLKKEVAEHDIIVFDVGANVGDYSLAVLKKYPEALIYAFEPHPMTFKVLNCSAARHGFKAFNCGLGDKGEKLRLYDYHSYTELGSQHASVYKEVIEEFHKSKAQQFDVDIITLDDFIRDNNINKIDLLKIDTEGNELNVLKGALVSLRNNIIDIIHFEFNGLNVISRIYMKDFFEILPNYSFYRMLSDGLIPMEYDHLTCEIFAFQNIVAIRNTSRIS